MEIARVPSVDECVVMNAVFALESLRQRDDAFAEGLASRGYLCDRGIQGVWEHLGTAEERRNFLLTCEDILHLDLVRNGLMDPSDYLEDTRPDTVAAAVAAGARIAGQEWMPLDAATAYCSLVRAIGGDGKSVPDMEQIRKSLSTLVDGKLTDGWFVVPPIERTVNRISADHLKQGAYNFISNGADAYDGERPMGMFSSGPKAWLDIIEQRGGELWAESRLPGEGWHSLTVRAMRDGRYYQHLEPSGGKREKRPYATRVEARVQLTPAEVRDLIENLPFGPVIGNGVRMLINGRGLDEGVVRTYGKNIPTGRISPPSGSEDNSFGAGHVVRERRARSETSPAKMHEVRVWIDTDGVAVEDNGCGMGARDLFALYLPRQGTKELVILNRAEALAVAEEYGQVEVREYNQPEKRRIHFSRRSERLFSVTLPETLRDVPDGDITLEFDAAIQPVSEARGQAGIRITEALPELMRIMMKKIIDTETDPVRVVRVVSAVSYGLNGLLTQSADGLSDGTETHLAVSAALTAIAKDLQPLIWNIKVTHQILPNFRPFYGIVTGKPTLFLNPDLLHRAGGYDLTDPGYRKILPGEGVRAQNQWQLITAPLEYDRETASHSPSADPSFLPTAIHDEQRLLPSVVDTDERISIVDRNVWETFEFLCRKEAAGTLTDEETMDLSLQRVLMQIFINPYARTTNEDVSPVYTEEPFGLEPVSGPNAEKPETGGPAWRHPLIVASVCQDAVSEISREYGLGYDSKEDIVPFLLNSERYFAVTSNSGLKIFMMDTRNKPVHVVEFEKHSDTYIQQWIIDQKQATAFYMDRDGNVCLIDLPALISGRDRRQYLTDVSIADQSSYRLSHPYQTVAWTTGGQSFIFGSSVENSAMELFAYRYDPGNSQLTDVTESVCAGIQAAETGGNTYLSLISDGKDQFAVAADADGCRTYRLNGNGIFEAEETVPPVRLAGYHHEMTVPRVNGGRLHYLIFLEHDETGRTVVVDAKPYHAGSGEICPFPDGMTFSVWDYMHAATSYQRLHEPAVIPVVTTEHCTVGCISIAMSGRIDVKLLPGDKYQCSEVSDMHHCELIQPAPWLPDEIWGYNNYRMNAFKTDGESIRRVYPDGAAENRIAADRLAAALGSFLDLGAPEEQLIYCLKQVLREEDSSPAQLHAFAEILEKLHIEHPERIGWLYDRELMEAWEPLWPYSESLFYDYFQALILSKVEDRASTEYVRGIFYLQKRRLDVFLELMDRLEPDRFIPDIHERAYLYYAVFQMFWIDAPENAGRMEENIRLLSAAGDLPRVCREILKVDGKNRHQYRTSPMGRFFCGESRPVEERKEEIRFLENTRIPVSVMAFFALNYGAETLTDMERVAQELFGCGLAECMAFINTKEYDDDWRRSSHFSGQTGTEIREMIQNPQDAIIREYSLHHDIAKGLIDVAYYLQHINGQQYTVMEIADNGCGLTEEACTAFGVSGVTDKNTVFSREAGESGQHGLGITGAYRIFDLLLIDTVRRDDDGGKSRREDCYRVTRLNDKAWGLTLVRTAVSAVAQTTPTGSVFKWAKLTKRGDPRLDVLNWQDSLRKQAGMIPVVSRHEPLPDGTRLPVVIRERMAKNGRSVRKPIRDEYDFMDRIGWDGKTAALYKSTGAAVPHLALSGKWMGAWTDGWLSLTHPGLRGVPVEHHLSMNLSGFPPTIDRGDVTEDRELAAAAVAQFLYFFTARERQKVRMALNDLVPQDFRTNDTYLRVLLVEYPDVLGIAAALNRDHALTPGTARKIRQFSNEKMALFLSCLETTDENGRLRSDLAEAVTTLLKSLDGRKAQESFPESLLCQMMLQFVSQEAQDGASKTVKRSWIDDSLIHQSVGRRRADITDTYTADPWFSRVADDAAHIGGYAVRVEKHLESNGYYSDRTIHLSEPAVKIRDDETPVHEGAHGMEHLLDDAGDISHVTHTAAGRFRRSIKLTASGTYHHRFGKKRD